MFANHALRTEILEPQLCVERFDELNNINEVINLVYSSASRLNSSYHEYYISIIASSKKVYRSRILFSSIPRLVYLLRLI